MAIALARRLLAEFVGTAILVFFGAGSIVAALQLNDGVLGYAGLGIVALSFALAVAIAVYAFGTTSGGHINPAVTIALAVTGRFSWAEVAPYIVAQLAGAWGGAALIVGVVGDRATDLGGVGLTTLGPGVSDLQGVIAEGVGTFLLMITIMALAVDRRAPVGWAGFVIGLAVACEIMVIGPFTNGSVNPARTFGPYVMNDLFGGPTPWNEYWIYIVGPVMGAVVAAVVYEVLVQPRAVPAPVPLSGEPAVASEAGPAPGEVPAEARMSEETGSRIVAPRSPPPPAPRREPREKGERP
ncbi:MAG: MIP/aquaporin family protein [Streptomycetales bacterium]